jgi:hypothetical protein
MNLHSLTFTPAAAAIFTKLTLKEATGVLARVADHDSAITLGGFERVGTSWVCYLALDDGTRQHIVWAHAPATTRRRRAS